MPDTRETCVSFAADGATQPVRSLDSACETMPSAKLGASLTGEIRVREDALSGTHPNPGTLMASDRPTEEGEQSR